MKLALALMTPPDNALKPSFCDYLVRTYGRKSAAGVRTDGRSGFGRIDVGPAEAGPSVISYSRTSGPAESRETPRLRVTDVKFIVLSQPTPPMHERPPAGQPATIARTAVYRRRFDSPASSAGAVPIR
jgi:hypothetical protein